MIGRDEIGIATMNGEILSIETSKKLAKYEQIIKALKDQIESIKEYDTGRPIYTGDAVIDCLNQILEIAEPNN